MTRAALEFSGVSHRYGAKLALDDVSFAVGEGELVCLVGPSGCGKTTALRVAAGLERQFAGSVVLDGRVVSGPGVHLAPERRRVGYMSQDLALFPHLDVRANVEFGLDGRERCSPRSAWPTTSTPGRTKSRAGSSSASRSLVRSRPSPR
jgi:iron(III) transport system ATP-binding protein